MRMLCVFSIWVELAYTIRSNHYITNYMESSLVALNSVPIRISKLLSILIKHSILVNKLINGGGKYLNNINTDIMPTLTYKNKVSILIHNWPIKIYKHSPKEIISPPNLNTDSWEVYKRVQKINISCLKNIEEMIGRAEATKNIHGFKIWYQSIVTNKIELDRLNYLPEDNSLGKIKERKNKSMKIVIK